MPTYLPTGEVRDFTYSLNMDSHFSKVRVHKNPADAARQVTVSSANVILNTAAGLNITGTVALGSGTAEDNGWVVAAAGTFTAGTAAGSATQIITDTHGNIANLVTVVDSTTLDPILSGGKEVFGLIQAASGTTDGDAITVTASSEDLQVSFVTADGDGTFTLATINATVNIGVNKAYAIGNNATYEVVGGVRGADVIDNSGSGELDYRQFTVTADFAAAEVLTLATGAGSVSGTSTTAGDTITIGASAGEFNGNPNYKVFIGGRLQVKGDDISWASSTTLTLNKAVLTGVVMHIEVPA
jgi:hypothetical protein